MQLSRDEIQHIALMCGFSLKEQEDGSQDLNEYVYLFAQELMLKCSPPSEVGTNRYGLDVGYFRKTINRELNRNLVDFKPDELARVLARLSRTADSTVMKEPEFLDGN